MLAAAKPLLLFLSLCLIEHVDACTTPPQPEMECCPDIDQYYCFTKTYSFIKFNPECPYAFIPDITLFTRSEPSGVPMQAKSIPSAFSNMRQTVIIVHGWAESINVKYLTMKNELLKHRDDYNVITVDWKRGSDSRFFLQASANTVTLGALVGTMVNNLRTIPGPKQEFWCIGTGLGAHVCGSTSQTASPLLDRITGVNPTGFDDIVGLKKGDAVHVDVIHADTRWGSLLPRGNVDFYPNGGKVQPGCTDEPILKDEELKQKIRNGGFATCSHGRALDFMIFSILYPWCQVADHECTDYHNLETSCTKIPSDRTHGVLGGEAIHNHYSGILYFKSICSPIRLYV